MKLPAEMTTGPPASVATERVHGKFKAESSVHDVKKNRSGEAQHIDQSVFFRWDFATVRNDHPNIHQTMCSRDRH
jgi:hypothetical protein